MIERERETMVGRWTGARWGLLLAAFALAAGCGGDDMTEPNDTEPSTLRVDEAQWLFSSIRGLQTDPHIQILHASEDSIVAACPAGGQVRITGAPITEEVADTLRFGYDYTVAPTGCQFVGEGETLTVDGDPGVRDRSIITMVGVAEEISLEGTVAGTLEWRLGDRFGSCQIDMVVSGDFQTSPTGPAVVATMAGKLCGHDAEFEVEPPSVPSG